MSPRTAALSHAFALSSCCCCHTLSHTHRLLLLSLSLSHTQEFGKTKIYIPKQEGLEVLSKEVRGQGRVGRVRGEGGRGVGGDTDSAEQVTSSV